ncbi:type IV pilus assembly protein PilM [Pseudoclavibacter sp. CFCC 11306]|uniref:type IV pilus assembly protein PilM n=1 Tax=Pseudoclavibacter sp. CFCC 11306 TaxID=1564493 RepID=UPI001300F2C1|nr:type IV pilus assembly protein PilM [Pseudoclavibacter sp. CFCC 11306]KAB1658848.1 type IV pilus assembly protein PilM [Pseudoclavibacter sp. CFCC 11306]
MSKNFIGIDVGHTALRGAQMRRSGSSLTVVKYHEVSLPHGVIVNGAVADPKQLTAALEDLFDEGGFTTRNVHIAVGNRRVYVREHSIPRVPLPEIKASLRYQVDDALPIDVNEAVLDFFPTRLTIDNGAPMYTGLLVATEAAPLEALADALTAARLRLVGVDLTTFALMRALHDQLHPMDASGAFGTDGDAGGVGAASARPTLIIDFGADTTQIVAIDGELPAFVRIIPAGGHSITQAVAAVHNIDLAEAEELKMSTGYLGGEARTDEEQAITTATDRVIDSIEDTVAYFRNTDRLHDIGQVIVTGGGSQLVGLRTALTGRLGLPLAEAQPLSGVLVANDDLRHEIDEHLATAAAALGLAEER